MELSIKLKTDTDAVTAYLDGLKPTLDRIDAHCAAAPPSGPVAAMVAALEDLVEGISDCGLTTAVETAAVESSVRVTFTPSPVLQHLGDLIGAICDALDAKAEGGDA